MELSLALGNPRAPHPLTKSPCNMYIMSVMTKKKLTCILPEQCFEESNNTAQREVVDNRPALCISNRTSLTGCCTSRSTLLLYDGSYSMVCKEKLQCLITTFLAEIVMVSSFTLILTCKALPELSCDECVFQYSLLLINGNYYW